MPTPPPAKPDSGLRALALIAGSFRVQADAVHLPRELASGERETEPEHIVRAAGRAGLKARIPRKATAERLRAIPAPAILRPCEGGFVIFGGVMKAAAETLGAAPSVPGASNPGAALQDERPAPAGPAPVGSEIVIARIMDPVARRAAHFAAR
jgi:hypothetical protein